MNPAELFRQESNTVQLAPGDFLFREGEKGDKMYVLLEGEVDISFLVILCSRLRARARSLVRWR
jgi:CRP-like cAMP-binding protein